MNKDWANEWSESLQYSKQEIRIKRSKEARECNAPTTASAPQGMTRLKLEDFAQRDPVTDFNVVVYANQGRAFELSLKVFTSLI